MRCGAVPIRPLAVALSLVTAAALPRSAAAEPAEPAEPRAAPAPPRPPGADVSGLGTQLTVTGGGTLRHGGVAAGLALAIEGERLGIHVGVDGLYSGGHGYGFDAANSFSFLAAHLTLALVRTDVGRLRAELGLSLLSWPNTYGPDAGAVSLGPDAGLSGRLALVGPLGLEGYVRVTPVAVLIVDWQAALAFHFGPAAVTAGWRELAVHRSSAGNGDVGGFAFAGPQVGLGLRY